MFFSKFLNNVLMNINDINLDYKFFIRVCDNNIYLIHDNFVNCFCNYNLNIKNYNFIKN